MSIRNEGKPQVYYISDRSRGSAPFLNPTGIFALEPLFSCPCIARNIQVSLVHYKLLYLNPVQQNNPSRTEQAKLKVTRASNEHSINKLLVTLYRSQPYIDMKNMG